MKDKSLFRRTKIVCTIGPSSGSPELMKGLIEAGMDVARLNFSHGDREIHRQTIRTLRTVSKEAGKEIGILQDLGGPKIRVGKLSGDTRQLHKGERVALMPVSASDENAIPVNYPFLLEDIHRGHHILLADGTVQLLVEEGLEDRIVCEVIDGGLIRSHKGVNFPSSSLRITALTQKDMDDLAVGLEEGVDFVALSFIRGEEDLRPVVRILEKATHRPMLIAKIEKPQAVDNFQEIMGAADGVMVARGDLGVEMALEDVPIIQKQIIRLARQAGKPVITATQMLTSMLENPRPTRAEATDVANAILDGTDALMLSDETAMGAYPIQAVSVLDSIARRTEPYLDGRPLLNEAFCELLPSTAEAISRAACWLALDLQAAAVVASTSSGVTARHVARFRPSCLIIALTDHLQ
ncbi:MAG: pyruvate kinase, partial [Syntrophobacteraceae bacterium]|nr:pyruvate kinase [Syntrophobacteraceae bacterium]